MLKLYETGEAESLLPVVAQVLQFSPAELTRCRDALHTRTEQLAAAAADGDAGDVVGYLGGWSSWMGGGK